MESTVLASDLRPGTQVVEHGGALLTVASVEPRGAKVIVRFERYGCGPAPSATVRATSRVRVLAA